MSRHRLGVDFAGTAPSHAALRDAGVSFVCRYLADPPNPKIITRKELDGHRRAGVEVVFVYEQDADTALGGFDRGVRDAHTSQRLLDDLGAGSAVVYYACDWDATPGQQAPINDYLRGAASVRGHDKTGVYGSYYVCERAMRADACAFAWQTYAWSGGLVSHHAALYQYLNGAAIGGCDVDLDHALHDDFGQWPRPERAEPAFDGPWIELRAGGKRLAMLELRGDGEAEKHLARLIDHPIDLARSHHSFRVKFHPKRGEPVPA